MTNAWDSCGSCSLFGIFMFPQFLHMSYLTRLLSLNCWFAFSGCLGQRIFSMSSEEHLLCFILCLFTCTCAEYSYCALGLIPLPPDRPALPLLRERAQSSRGQWALHRVAHLPGWAHGGAWGGDVAFGDSQQAKAVQVLVRWGSVLLPS